MDYANGTSIDYAYAAASRLTTIDSTTDTGHHEYGYTYDKVGNRLTLMPPPGTSVDPISLWPHSSGRTCLFFACNL